MSPSEQGSLQALLGLTWNPVAITFTESAPAGVPRVSHSELAGCGYWRTAADSSGSVFYTVAEDHYQCPVGAHTHGVDLPQEVAAQLQQTVGLMVDVQYLRMEEIPQIPRRTEPFRVAVYAPLDQAPLAPDVVLVRGTARQIMLLTEASLAAGLGPDTAAMGRPACAVIPATLSSGRTATSLGCIGNRVYTGLEDTEFYLALPGNQLETILDHLLVIVKANEELEAYHRARVNAG